MNTGLLSKKCAKKESVNTLRRNIMNDKQAVENLPIIFNEGNEIVFNRAAVRFEGVEPRKIEQDIETAQEFLASEPDLSDKTQYKQLVALLSMLRGHRTGLDKKRKGLSQIFRDATDYINGKAKELIGPAQEVENQLKELRNAHDAEVERIAQEEARKEEERINRIESRICFIRDLPSECIGKNVVTIDGYICDMLRTDEDFQEFEETGNAIKERTLNQLGKLLEYAIIEERRAEEQRTAEEERRQLEAEETECRAAEDFGQTVAALSDLLGKVCECQGVADIAETVAEAIQDGEIPFVRWNNSWQCDTCRIYK